MNALEQAAAPASHEAPDTPTEPEQTSAPARLRGLRPGWFGAVMGTGIVAVAASFNPGRNTALASAARTAALTRASTGVAAGGALPRAH